MHMLFAIKIVQSQSWTLKLKSIFKYDPQHLYLNMLKCPMYIKSLHALRVQGIHARCAKRHLLRDTGFFSTYK